MDTKEMRVVNTGSTIIDISRYAVVLKGKQALAPCYSRQGRRVLSGDEHFRADPAGNFMSAPGYSLACISQPSQSHHQDCILLCHATCCVLTNPSLLLVLRL